jgi:uncharacterized membrane protein YccC
MPDMRIAVTIVAGALTLVIAYQSGTTEIGEVAWFIALLYLLGAGCAYGMPALAVVVFGLAGVVSIGIATNGNRDLFGLWGVVACALAGLSAAGWREKRRIVRRRIVHRVIDEELVPMDAVRPSRGADPSV